MGQVGIRESRQRASDILRRVREDGEAHTIAYRGRVVARLVPAAGAREAREVAARVWADIDQLAWELAASWPASASAEEAVGEQRREL